MKMKGINNNGVAGTAVQNQPKELPNISTRPLLAGPLSGITRENNSS